MFAPCSSVVERERGRLEEKKRARDRLCALLCIEENDAEALVVERLESWLAEWRTSCAERSDYERAGLKKRCAERWMVREATRDIQRASEALDVATAHAAEKRAAFEEIEALLEKEEDARSVKKDLDEIRRIVRASQIGRWKARRVELAAEVELAHAKCSDFRAFFCTRTATRFPSGRDDARAEAVLRHARTWIKKAKRRLAALDEEMRESSRKEVRLTEENDAALVSLSRASVARDTFAAWKETRVAILLVLIFKANMYA